MVSHTKTNPRKHMDRYRERDRALNQHYILNNHVLGNLNKIALRDGGGGGGGVLTLLCRILSQARPYSPRALSEEKRWTHREEIFNV